MTLNLTKEAGLNESLPAYFLTYFEPDEINEMVKCLTHKFSLSCFAKINDICLHKLDNEDGETEPKDEEYVKCLRNKFKLFGLNPKEVCTHAYDSEYHEMIDNPLEIDPKDIVGHFIKHYNQDIFESDEEDCYVKYEPDYFEEVVSLITNRYQCYVKEVFPTEYRPELII